jgi:hypothetical protein
MSKKLLSHSVKILKLGTWIGGILAALVVLVVAVVMVFPVLIQGPLEAQLSELSDLDVKISKPYFDFKDDNLFLKIDKLEAFNIGSAPNSNPLGGQKSLVVAVDKFGAISIFCSPLTNIFLISNAFKNSNISEFGSAAKV